MPPTLIMRLPSVKATVTRGAFCSDGWIYFFHVCASWSARSCSDASGTT